MRLIGAIALGMLLAVAGCGKTAPVGSPDLTGEEGKPGTSLAYEHTVSVAVPEGTLGERMSAVRQACSREDFGSCSLLRFEDSNGSYPSGLLTVRIVPSGVEPLVALASKDGVIGSRQTSAEDLAEVVADTDRQKEQLLSQQARLLDFQNRKDLAVADLIALAKELSRVESGLVDLDRASINFQRRIETNLLTIRFSTNVSDSRWSSVGRSFSGSLDSFAEGVSEVIDMIAFGIPFLIVFFPLALVWRWLWRRMTQR